MGDTFTRRALVARLGIVACIAAMVVWASVSAVRERERLAMEGRRNDARVTASMIAALQERFFLENRTYTTDLARLGFEGAPRSVDGHYVLRVEACAGEGLDQCYRIVARADPRGAQRGDRPCAELVLDAYGVKRPAECW